ncbi:hypothetical protein [Actinobacillus pleuropneumoniae]
MAQVIDIPFCVAGGIKTIEDAEKIIRFRGRIKSQ